MSDAGFSMTPLIDVVFLLVLLLLLSRHLAQQETELALQLPAMYSGQQDAGGNRPRMTVNVLEDGRLFIANRAVDSNELARLLVDRRAAHGDALQVRIRAARAVPYHQVEGVLIACARAGIQNIALAVQSADAPQ